MTEETSRDNVQANKTIDPVTGELTSRGQAIWQSYVALGWTYKDIAEEYEISYQRVGQVLRDIKDALPKMDKQEVVDLRLEQLKVITKGLMPKASTGDANAVATLLRVAERESKYLGLDSAEKIEHSGGLTYDIAGLPNFDLDE